MSREFVSNVGGAGTRFRISFSEEKPEPKVSKLTFSSDFTHSYEESYEGEDDVLVVDIDYGERDVNEDSNGHEDTNENDIDSLESISRSSSLSNSFKREKPKFGLRRFKSVEEIIDVSPAKQKLQKTVSDYEARYKGLEKKETRLTLSADFTHSYEENFEEDGDMLVVDIDYSQGGEERTAEGFEDGVFSASDHFGHVDTRNKSELRKFHSHEDIRSSLYKHRELERSSSGYEITFINENRPDEMKKLSLSADLLTTSEEIVLPNAELETLQTVQNIENVADDELFNVNECYVTSTPHKNAKGLHAHDSIEGDGVTKDIQSERELPFVGASENTSVDVQGSLSNSESLSLHTEEPLESYRLALRGGSEEEFNKDDGDYDRGKEEEIARNEIEEDKTWTVNVEKEASGEADSNAPKLDIGGLDFGGPEALLKKPSVHSDYDVSKNSLGIRGIEGDESRESSEASREGDGDDEIVRFRKHEVRKAEGTTLDEVLLKNNVEAEFEGPSEVIGDDMRIDLDDILIIDIDSNDRDSENATIDESSGLDRKSGHNDNTEIEKAKASKRAELYIYSVNQNTENGSAGVVDKNIPCIDSNISQREEAIPSNGIHHPIIIEKKVSVDKELIVSSQNEDTFDTMSNDSVKGHDVPFGQKSPVDEGASVTLQPVDPSFGAKMRLVELAENGWGESTESVEEVDVLNDNSDCVKNVDEVCKDEEHEKQKFIMNGGWEDNENQQRISDSESGSMGDSVNKDITMGHTSYSVKENLESGIKTGSFRGIDKVSKDLDGEIEEKLDGDRDSEEDRDGNEGDDGDNYYDRDDGGDQCYDGAYYQVQGCEESAEDSKKVMTKKFFKMIISPEVENGYSSGDSYQSEIGSAERGSKQSARSYEPAQKCEYIFPMPEEVESTSKYGEIGKDEELAGKEVSQTSYQDSESERGVGSDKGKKVWRGFWWSSWIFRKKSTKAVGSSKKENLTDLGEGPIPNGACKVADDHDDIVLSERKTGPSNYVSFTREVPKLINKVYRLKDIHHGRRILTETIRVFLQQEDILSHILKPGH